MAGRWPAGKRTSTTGPKICAMVPVVLEVSVVVMIRLVVPWGVGASGVDCPGACLQLESGAVSAQRFRAAHDVEQLLGDRFLALAVVDLLQRMTERLGRVRR